MASVLSYPMSASDPFVAPPPARKSVDDSAARYPSPTFSLPIPTTGSHHHHSRPSTASTTRASVSSSRPPASRTSAYQTIIDEFGSCLPHQPIAPATVSVASTAASSSAAQRSQHPHRVSIALPVSHTQPTAAMSSAQASSHTHSAAQAAAAAAQAASSSATASAQARKRQSHNPSSLVQASPPKAEYLSDEYVLHPSVHAFKLAHPQRPMIALGHYILLQTLGEGEFGKVKLGVHSDYGVEVAIKLIRRGTLEDEQRASKVEREIEVLRQLKHPNIVRMLDVIDTAKYIGIVLEFAGGGELFDYILANRYLKEKDASRLFAQLISGVDYLHQKHIVHRDLKLENLLLDKHRNIIITDFGFANRFERDEDDLMSTSCGSPCYAAPELVVTEGLYVGTAVDVWSCGVILYAMVAGYLPYDDDPANPDGDNINLLYKYIMSTSLNFPEHMSDIVKDLLLVMLIPNPQDRGTIAQIEEHLWLEPHHALFERSVKEHELIFADNMIRKSQQAKRDLATRRRLQQEAKLVKALQRSQSTGAGVALSGAEQHRRSKEQRHRSALPGASTVPEFLNQAGGNFVPSPDSPQSRRSGAYEPADMERNATLPAMPVTHTAPSSSASSQTPTKRAGSVKRPSETPVGEREPPATPTRSKAPQPPKAPMSANKNRHTIQVEYDGDMSWEQVRPDLMPAGRDTSSSSKRTPSPATPPTKALDVPQATDIEIESSSDFEASEAVSIAEPPEKEAAPTLTEPPVVLTPVAPPAVDDAPGPTAVPASVVRAHTPPLPQPLASSKRSRDEPETPRDRIISTPKSTSSRLTDRASNRPPSSHHRASLPPGAGTPTQQPSITLAPELVRQSPRQSPAPLPPSRGPSAAARRASRTRKGMSLDKFGLAKLLGGTNSSEVDLETRQSYIPVSKHNKSHSMYQPGSQSQSVNYSPGSDAKKSRRKTLNLLGNRASSTADAMSTTSSIHGASAAPPVVVGPQGIRPASDQQSQSAASIVTVDRDPEPPRTASSGPAKRVMDWFRRKSAKDSLSTIQAGSVRTTDSGTSAGRASMSMDRTFIPATLSGRPRMSMDHAAISETASVSHTVDTGPIIVIEEEPIGTQTGEEEKKQESKENAHAAIEPKTGPEFTRQPLAPASSKANVEPKIVIETSKLRTPDRSGIPLRSKSQRTPSSGMANGSASPILGSPLSSRGAGAAAGGTEAKLRLHTGLVDQSALSSRPPKEIMAEATRVLQSMGIEIKEEADFRLRCTRVRRRKGEPTISVSSGAFARMATLGSSTSIHKLNTDGRPISATASAGIAGLKGMLLRRGSSYSSHNSSAMPRGDSNAHPSIVAALAGSAGDATPPLYGEHSIDSGDEVKFVVELCRIKNLNGLYLLSIKRLRGSVWSFKFIYQTIVERCETLTH